MGGPIHRGFAHLERPRGSLLERSTRAPVENVMRRNDAETRTARIGGPDEEKYSTLRLSAINAFRVNVISGGTDKDRSLWLIKEKSILQTPGIRIAFSAIQFVDVD